jgi:hypothetical protein
VVDRHHHQLHVRSAVAAASVPGVRVRGGVNAGVRLPLLRVRPRCAAVHAALGAAPWRALERVHPRPSAVRNMIEPARNEL